MYQNESEYNQYITHKHCVHTQEIVGRPDVLTIPNTVTTIQKDWGSIFFAKEYETIDTFIIFVHGGIRVPTGFEHLIAVETIQSIDSLATTILLNVDLGSALMASNVLTHLHNHPEIGVIWYDYTRVVGDPNRTKLADQLPDQPYKGANPWTADAATPQLRQEILASTLYPFFSDLEQLIELHKPRVIISPHTYDTTSGGNTTVGVKDLITAGELRPAGMIFQENTSDEPGTDFTLLPKEKLAQIQEMYQQTLGELSTLQYQAIEVGIDYPYMAPVVLSVWLKKLQDAHHLMFEVRKDAFNNCSETDVLALTEFMLNSRRELLN